MKITSDLAQRIALLSCEWITAEIAKDNASQHDNPSALRAHCDDLHDKWLMCTRDALAKAEDASAATPVITAVPDDSRQWKSFALELHEIAHYADRHNPRVVEIGAIIYGDEVARRQSDSENLVRLLDARAQTIMGPRLRKGLVDELRAALGLKP